MNRFGSLEKSADNVDAIQKKENAANDVTDDDRIYYEPPVEAENSRRRKLGHSETQGIVIEDSVYENCEMDQGFITFVNEVENVYEPIKEHLETEGNTDSVENGSKGISDERHEMNNDNGSEFGNKKESLTQNLEKRECPSYPDVIENDAENIIGLNGESGKSDKDKLDSMFSKEDLDSDHLYVNGNVDHNSASHFYVTPKYSYGQAQMAAMTESNREKKESIYDVPK